jgi:hypothetical protein
VAYSHPMIPLLIVSRLNGRKILVGKMILCVSGLGAILFRFLFHHLRLSTLIISGQMALQQVFQGLLISLRRWLLLEVKKLFGILRHGKKWIFTVTGKFSTREIFGQPVGTTGFCTSLGGINVDPYFAYIWGFELQSVGGDFISQIVLSSIVWQVSNIKSNFHNFGSPLRLVH